MPQIHILPVDVRNKISAGEVIERPASVVKELIENALDAGATEIAIEIFRGGKQLIKVTDNGTGMDRDDALLCLERHATSKLNSEDDLFNIRTMGFRGEALPSIAAVSKMTLRTGTKNAPSGVSFESIGGAVRDIRDHPFIGTSLEVRDLFFNTPARKKFLKTDSTELFHIIDAVTREALAHWETGFTLFAENRETLVLPPASEVRERILQIHGLEFMDNLTEVRAGGHGISLTAFASKGERFRNTRSHQFLFINRRPVRDLSVSRAVYAAYEGLLPQDKHPLFFLFLDIDPRKVDVNVHPTKREVRFANKDDIYRFILQTLRDPMKAERSRSLQHFTETPASHPAQPYAQHHSSRETVIAETLAFPYRPALPFIYLGDTFLATAGRGGLTLIDHHAAHERILYERLLRKSRPDSLLLLFPRHLKLSHQEHRVALERREVLAELGIELEDFGHDTLLIRSLPETLRDADLQGIFSDIASTVRDGTQLKTSLRENLAATIACHSSVRGKEILHQEELGSLLADLDATEHPDQCPHGRPTRIFLSLDDLKKMFKRK